MPKTGRRNEKVEVSHRLSLLAQLPTLAPEDVAYVVVHGQDNHAGYEL